MSRIDSFCARYWLINLAAGLIHHTADLHGVQLLQVALFIADKFSCHDGEFTRVIAEDRFGFLLCIVQRIHIRELRPRIGDRVTLQRCLFMRAELGDALTAVAQRSCYTVGTGIPAAEYNHILACRRDEVTVLQIGVQVALNGAGQIVHCVHYTFKLTAFNIELARLGRSAAQDNSIVFVHQLLGRNILADLCVNNEVDAFSRQQVYTALYNTFIKLHCRNTICQQSADAVAAFEYSHGMPGFVQLCGCRKTCRT
ncbi:hypothetical protein D3C73_928110 [compost metagenome]